MSVTPSARHRSAPKEKCPQCLSPSGPPGATTTTTTTTAVATNTTTAATTPATTTTTATATATTTYYSSNQEQTIPGAPACSRCAGGPDIRPISLLILWIAEGLTQAQS